MGKDFIEAVVFDTVRRLLPSDPTVSSVADALSMQVRTLQRRLADASLSYRHILDECRREQAEAELSKRELSVAEISRRLGYSDPAHFVRAFRRWTGESPTRFGAKRKG